MGPRLTRVRHRNSKPPSSSDDGAAASESDGESDEGSEKDTSGSDEDDNDDDDGDKAIDVADDDVDDDDGEDDDEEEEGGAEGKGPSAYPLLSSSVALGSEAAVPSLPVAADEDDVVTMDVEMGTIHLAQAPGQQETSGAMVAPASSGARAQSPQASSNGSVSAPLGNKRSWG